MSKLHPLFDLLRSDAFITVNKLLSLAIGVNESMLYAELLSRHAYFEDRELLNHDGYFFNTVIDLYLGTGLTERQQRPAIAKLKSLGLIDMKVFGLPAKRFFKVLDDVDKVQELLEYGRQITRKVRFGHSSDKMSELEPTKVQSNKNNTRARNRQKKNAGNGEEFEGYDSGFHEHIYDYVDPKRVKDS